MLSTCRKMELSAFSKIQLVQYYVVVLCCYALSFSKAVPISGVLSQISNSNTDLNKQTTHTLLFDVDTMDRSSSITSLSSSSLSSVSEDDTEEFIDPPVCGKSGESEDQTSTTGGRQRRYVHVGGKWSGSKVTYRILNYPRRGKPSKAKIHKNIARAFKLWESASNLEIEQVYSGHADIVVSFAKNKHGDAYPFDGKGGWLAHAFYPRSGHGDMNGDIHFDDSEKFSLRPGKAGYNFFYVASHEIGHSLGMGHSHIAGALMHDAYPKNPYNVKLTQDDIDGIQGLYGVPDDQTNDILDLL